MKLDTRHLRYLSGEDWRVLTAVEIGSKNHEVVPTKLITQLSNLRGGSGVHKCISTLAKANLIAKVQNTSYDGYRLTYGGLDYLALHTHLKREVLYSTGNCIGTGKESDIYICAAHPRHPSNLSRATTSSSTSTGSTARDLVIKLHRLGRISFRNVKNKRDYLRHRSSASWLYMSRLSAQREFAFMQALYEADFRVPEPIAWSRHTVVMSLIENSIPLRSIKEVGDTAALYEELIEMIMRLADHGLIHGDFNEFNILIKAEPRTEQDLTRQPDTTTSSETSPLDRAQVTNTAELEDASNIKAVPYMIDFPQAMSIDHPNAEYYFNRDVQCIKNFFARKLHYEIDGAEGPTFAQAMERARKRQTEERNAQRIDLKVEASGFSKKMARELEAYMREVGAGPDQESVNGESTAEFLSGDDSEDEPPSDDPPEIDYQNPQKEDLADHGQQQNLPSYTPN